MEKTQTPAKIDLDALAEKVSKRGGSGAKSSQSEAGTRLVDAANKAHQRALMKQVAPDGQAQLPFWPNDRRAIPNDYARSALFTVRNKRTPRRFYQDHAVYHLHSDTEMVYTGQELRCEDDELVWMQVLEFAKHGPIDAPVVFSFYQLCTELGWPLNGRYYDKAEECLTRLQTTSVKTQNARLGAMESLSLISRFQMVERGTRKALCRVFLEPNIVAMFGGVYFTTLKKEEHYKMTPIARKMYSYINSHKQPFPMSLERFQKVCGSDCARPRKWAEMTRKACEEVMSYEVVRRVWVEKGAIHFVR